MKNPRGTKKEELDEVMRLINQVFRISRGEKPSMQEEFPLLFNAENSNNMRVIFDQNKAISVVSFVTEQIFIEGSKINAASIGGVCTDEAYRGNKYATTILDDVEKRMLELGVDIVLISGERDLYQRRNCVLANSFYEYKILKQNIRTEFEIEVYKKEHLSAVINLYHQNSTRYLRTFDEFEKLIESATIAWGKFSYKKYILKINNEIKGYIILRIIKVDFKFGQVIECSGDNKLIEMALKQIAFDENLEYILLYVHKKDIQNHLNQNIERKIVPIQGTIKIINFTALMSNLKGYFLNHSTSQILNEIQFFEDEKGYYFKLEDETFCIDDIKTLNLLIFEGSYILNDKLKYYPKIKKWMDTVFPIPFVWTANLNYQ